jgi:type IX secretion system PorP/SprF family membrane protein
MKTLIKTTTLLVCLSSLSAEAQQAPMYTHYMYNTLVINPGYAGSRDALTVTALHRSQWVDYKGAPMTQTITLHSPLKNDKIGLGLSIMNDKIGPTNNTSAFVDFAYRIKLNDKSKLALGLSAGANMFQANLNTLSLDEQVDPAFQNNIKNDITPNFGFGAYYSREKFYAGISAPSLLENSYSDNNPVVGSNILGTEQRHYFLILGGVVKLSENVDFKPTTLVKLTPAAPLQGDVTASFIFAKKLVVGAMFRTGDAFGALVGINLFEHLRLGYSYDWSYGNQTGKYNKGSHEIMLRYDFIKNSNKQIHSPRYF